MRKARDPEGQGCSGFNFFAPAMTPSPEQPRQTFGRSFFCSMDEIRGFVRMVGGEEDKGQVDGSVPI